MMQNNSFHPLSNYLDHILNHTSFLWEKLRNQCIFVTGGTGFIGRWLLESFIWANTKYQLNAKAVVLTRNKEGFKQKCPHLYEQPALEFFEGDVRSFEFFSKNVSYFIHAATDVSVKLNRENPELIYNTIVQGAKRTLEFANYAHAKQFLFLSSGAVYGKQPFEISHLTEECQCTPDQLESAYAKGKSVAENLCREAGYHSEISIKIARCFAFVGPELPLDLHYAIGNFIRDGLKGGPVVIEGDGTVVRSYLHVADLVIWLWTILLEGKSHCIYNVGSEDAITLREVANYVANYFTPQLEVKVLKPTSLSVKQERYIPDTKRAAKELKLIQRINLIDSIASTIDWYLNKKSETLIH